MPTQNSKGKKFELLLHICCMGCGAYISKLLRQDYGVALYFYNPNIFPKDEYGRRWEETRRIADQTGLDLLAGEYDHGAWLDKIRGHEDDPERGERCRICYQDRLEKTAVLAKEKGFDFFTTTLTISPHKDAAAISKIGHDLSERRGVKFLDQDFKKKDGFKKSVALSRQLGLYRQNYCGCEFSKNCNL